MKKTFFILLIVFSSVILHAQAQLGSWKDTRPANILLITIKNTCSNCKKSGPDYTGLIVYDSQGKIIAQEAINGIPTNGKSRLYYVHCTKRLKVLTEKIKVSLVHYCTDIQIKK